MFFKKQKQNDISFDIKEIDHTVEQTIMAFKQSLTVQVESVDSRQVADRYMKAHAKDIIDKMSEAAMKYSRVVLSLKSQLSDCEDHMLTEKLTAGIKQLEDAYAQVFVVINAESPRTMQYYYTQAEIADLIAVPDVATNNLPSDFARRLSQEYVEQYLPEESVFAKCMTTPPAYSPEDVLKMICFGDFVGQDDTNFDFEKPQDMSGNKFTDNTVLSLAVYDVCKTISRMGVNARFENGIAACAYNLFIAASKYYAGALYDTGYDPKFYSWVFDGVKDYASVMNDGTVRAGVIGAFFYDVHDVIRYTIALSYPTHFDKAGEQGAVFFAVLVWMCLHGANKNELRDYLYLKADDIICTPADLDRFPEKIFDLLLTPDDIGTLSDDVNLIKTTYGTRSLSQALICFLNAKSPQDCLSNTNKFACDRASVSAMSNCFGNIYYRDMLHTDWLEQPLDDSIPYETRWILKKLKSV